MSVHNNRYIRVVVFLIILLFSFEIYGQSENSSEPKIIPPSPTAYELGRYGQADVGTFTGTPNISVPVYTYKTKSISVPISLNYSSNGIQVDQMETNVGLGWNLNIGGVINRIVRGKADENRKIAIPDYACLSDDLTLFMDKNQLEDLQPDLYSYNFQGHSGQFVFDNSGNAVMVPQNNLKIQLSFINHQYVFKITTEDGVEYHFNDAEYSTWESAQSPQTIATGWYLSKIIHPNGEIINFAYKDSNYSYITNISESFGIKLTEESCPTLPPYTVPSDRNVNYLSILGKSIERISSNDPKSGYVFFEQTENPNLIGNYLVTEVKIIDGDQNIIENANLEYLFTANKRIFLNSCTFKDTSKKYSFYYEDPEELVDRLSEQKDFWGFYNGKPGIYPDADLHKDLYPSNYFQKIKTALKNRSRGDKRSDAEYAKKGILKKVIYPTKGYNELDYEPNSTWGTVTSPLEIKKENHWFYNPSYDNQEQTKTIIIANKSDYDTEITANVFYNDYELVSGEFPIGELFVTVTVENLTSPGYDGVTITAFEHNKPKTAPFTFLKNNTYKITIVFSPETKTTGNVNFEYCNGGGVESMGNIPAPGLRIKEIRSYDTAVNRTDVKHYFYGKKETPNVSTGLEGVKINVLTSGEIRRICPDNLYIFEKITTFITIHSGSIYPLYKSIGNSSVTYRNVTVSHGGANFENGGEEFSYHVAPDMLPYACYGSVANSVPWINSGWNNGLLYKKRIFNKNLIDVSIQNNTYKLEDLYTQTIPAIASEFRYSPNFHYPGNANFKNIEHLNIVKYATNSYWFYLESEENIQKDLTGLGSISTLTTFKYNNALHKKVSSQTTTTSTGEKLLTKYFYAQDSEMAGEPFKNELIANNMIGVVLDTQTLNEGVKLSEQKTVYTRDVSTSNLLLPKYIYSNKGAAGLDSNTDKKITFDKYDEKGNVLQYTPEGGMPVSIIWGYNKTQPIAKIENATYDQIASYVGNVQSLSDADNDNCMSNNCSEQILRVALNSLRSSLPDLMVSTYTYNPLVGVTSVTDTKGISSFYEYDSFGRLKFVKDEDLNVLQKYCYNYKGQQTDCSDNDSSTVVLYKSSAISGSFTKSCRNGAGSTVTFGLENGAVSSTISQADADAKAAAKLSVEGQAYADANGFCTYRSAAVSGSFTKNNCSTAGVGSLVAYSLAEGALTSRTSQADADEQALLLFNTDGQAYANANGFCVYKSAALSGSFTKNDCGPGGSGSSVAYSQPEGALSSNNSQAEADAQALILFNTNGQANANTNGSCIFYSAARSGYFTKNNCDAGGYGGTVLYNQPYGATHSNSSQAEADSFGLTKFNVEGQSYANANGTCTFNSAALSGTFTKNNCTVGGYGSIVVYNQSSGAASSNTSQADADALGAYKFNQDGQAYANANGICTFYSVPRSDNFTKTDCGVGGYGSTVAFSQGQGYGVSNISQEEADAQALIIFNTNGKNYANANGYCTYYSVPMTGSFTKRSCATGGYGSVVAFSQGQGYGVSNSSQADADAQATVIFNRNGQDYADANGYCTFYSVSFSGNFSKNNCSSGGYGSSVAFNQAAGVVSSTISQADADALGLSKFNTEGQAYANGQGYCTFYSTARSGYFTKNNCAAGGYGSAVLYNQGAGVVSSTVSQADADALGLDKFNTDGQVFANNNGYCTFYSTAFSGSYTKNSCSAGGYGSALSYSQPAGAVLSYSSQADADALGLNKFNQDGQAYVNANGYCTFYSASLSGSFTKNSCSAGGYGSMLSYSQPAGAVLSYSSQADADALGLNKFNQDGQAYVNANGYCTFYSTALSGSFTKNNCASGGYGSSVPYSQAAGTVVSTVSQADADANGLTRFNTYGQNNANNNGICTFWSIAKSGVFTRNNCASGGTPGSITYTVPAGGYTSNTSQAAADDLAQADVNANGQTFANSNGTCTFWNNEKSGLFTRNNCASGGIPETIAYTVPGGRYSSNTTQTAADDQAQAEINAYGQTFANANGKCTFLSSVRRVSFTRNNCSFGGSPQTVMYTVPQGQYLSTISQLDADSQAQNDIDNNAQTYANANGICTFYSSAINGSFTKNDCTSGTTGSNVSYSQTAGAVTSTLSQADANFNASTKFNIDGQAYANANGICNSVVITNTCTLNFNRVSGSTVMYKNGSAYLSASRSGSSSGELGTGDTFYVVVNASTAYYKSITITSSVRGTLFMYGPNKIGTSATSATFTKVGSEVITIDCVATDMLD